MSIADIIKSIECGAFREIQPHKIGGRNGEPIDCYTLEDEPVIVADNEVDRQALRDSLGVIIYGISVQKNGTGDS